MANKNGGITVYLTVGKGVKLIFDSENNLSNIRLSINKVAELFGNNVVDEESIFLVSTVALITKSNYKTFVPVDIGREIINGITNDRRVKIDQKRTSNKKGNKNVYEQGYFEFFVSEENKVPKRKLIVPRNFL
ncbi:TPA: hypothetical protein IXR49_000962 [Enterococcus faecium]|jgi:hypothetical protein|uniref:hypothetical protein n=1 Tax=Enterococcus TaxID=1350 RepID=UPI0002A242D9|nr:hypothetical protein [Enterococcus faecium]VTQ71211.1 Uncharacterised protein [Enterococcus hirae]ELA82294.1 hypothetical protein OI1_06151 [Enterococcus faecium EnGen0016]EZP89091.1 hypothetical protein Z973_13565 [Enterococcus faecium VRE1044]EZP95238.1 hypothetical protein Z974_13165 [Enterococcus faecium VRE1261]KWX92422.1 hypothetical protein AS222_00495 [Enterococcus faecium]